MMLFRAHINATVTREWIAQQTVFSFPLNNEVRGRDRAVLRYSSMYLSLSGSPPGKRVAARSVRRDSANLSYQAVASGGVGDRNPVAPDAVIYAGSTGDVKAVVSICAQLVRLYLRARTDPPEPRSDTRPENPPALPVFLPETGRFAGKTGR
jgi:hypothetical protein